MEPRPLGRECEAVLKDIGFILPLSFILSILSILSNAFPGVPGFLFLSCVRLLDVRSKFAVCVILSIATACTAGGDATRTVQRLALDTLFNGREHARELVIWSSETAGPALEQILIDHGLEQHPVDVQKLASTIPANTIDEATLTRIFRDNPDAWAEFFRRYPRSSGLVELSPVRFSSGNTVAETYVGRSCGEHCRNAWRIVARRDETGTWTVTELRWLRVPGT